jgi:N-sulfoglucosamine sulfohydrolase
MRSLLLFGIFALVSAGAATAAGADPRPNILLIVGEDVGPQLGCYGDPVARTPRLDRLAAESVRFERAFVTQSVCSPSRASILTGLYPHQHGQIGLATHQFRMVRRWPTMPGLLQAAGYRTGRLGKLHVLPEDAFPFDFVWDDPKHIGFRNRDVRTTAEVARRFMDGGGPFFLMVNFADAHTPFLRQSHGLPADPITAAQAAMPPTVGVNTERLRTIAADYYNSVARLDTGVGLLLDELERAGLARSTVVIFLGDHGPQFSRGKTTCFELALHVPLLLKWPQGAPAVRRELVSAVDLLPTVLELARLPPPGNLPGSSLLAPAAGPEARRYVFAEWNTSHPFPGPSLLFPQRSVRDDRYKLIVSLLTRARNPVEDYYTSQALLDVGPSQAEIDSAPPDVAAAYATWRQGPPLELYDLLTDPAERVNLAGRPEFAGVQARLLEALQHWRQATGDPLLDPAKVAQLAAEDAERIALIKRDGAKNVPPWRYPSYLYGVTDN